MIKSCLKIIPPLDFSSIKQVVFITYYHMTNYPKIYWLKITIILIFSYVSIGQEFRQNTVGYLIIAPQLEVIK